MNFNRGSGWISSTRVHGDCGDGSDLILHTNTVSGTFRWRQMFLIFFHDVFRDLTRTSTFGNVLIWGTTVLWVNWLGTTLVGTVVSEKKSWLKFKVNKICIIFKKILIRHRIAKFSCLNLKNNKKYKILPQMNFINVFLVSIDLVVDGFQMTVVGARAQFTTRWLSALYGAEIHQLAKRSRVFELFLKKWD